MLRSMYSGISGMKVNQTKLDVIGNNIANVNTTGFKSSRTTFSDLLSQNTKGATAPSSTKGGTNSQQIGLGVQLASIDKIMTQGSMQTTNRNLDVAIDGTGYFMVSAGGEILSDTGIQVSHKAGTHTISANNEGSIKYTRNGAFIRDSEGNLLSSDGYRVLGYSLTNDDSSMAATAIKPDAVRIDTLTFGFGAGSQLNGFKFQLGTIAQRTPTSADINGKVITINGDFSSDSSVTCEQIQSAILKTLAAKGISQNVEVGGSVPKYDNIATKSEIIDGSDALAPAAQRCAGLKFEFEKGDLLNGYKIVIDNVAATTTSADIDEDNKLIKISGDFINGNINKEKIAKDINDKAKVKFNIDTNVVKGVTGTVSSFTGLKSETTGTAKVSKAPSLNKNSIAGVEFDIKGKGAKLNDYKIKLKDDKNSALKAEFNGNILVISGNLADINKSTELTKLNEAIKNQLDNHGVSDITLKIKDTSHFDSTQFSTTDSITIQGGVNTTSAGTASVGGFKVELPTADDLVAIGFSADFLDGYTFKIVDINSEDLNVDISGKEILIKGNFVKPSGVLKSDLETELNNKISQAIANGKDLGIKVNNDSNKVYKNTESEEISGGSILKQGSAVEGFGFKFTPKFGGSALNGYKIVIGNIAYQNGIEANVDTNAKTIIVNANFANGNITEAQLKEAINRGIGNSSLGSNVSIDVTAVDEKPDLSETKSEEAAGGTSVQSLDTNGSINYVNGNSTVYAYDGSLKTLKIPDTVIKNGVAVAVQDYSIQTNGVINVTLADQSIAAIGQIAMASFSNPAGLESVGGSLFTEGVNSGTAIIKSGIRTIEDDNSSAFGSNIAGYLEMSNVDLAEQFTDMIVTTKAFQGSSKMITTGDEILSEIINLKR